MAMASRYECKLSNEALNTAIEKLNEPTDNEERLKAIDSLREAFKSANPDLPLTREDDGFVLRFLRARKFDQGRALKMMTNYHKYLSEWPEVYEKSPVLLKHLMEKGSVLPLHGKAKSGSTVLVLRPGFVENTLVSDMLALVFLSLEKLLESEETQIYGVVFINDLAYLNSALAKQITPLVAKRFFSMIQDGMPMSLKMVNFINEPKIFDGVFAIIQPFLSEKLKKRIVLHGTNFSNLYEVVERSVLPVVFAGSGPEMEVEGWMAALQSTGTAL